MGPEDVHPDIRYENWRDYPICIFDLESTGTDPNNCKIVQIYACLMINWDIKGEFHTLVNPEMSIPEGASKYHKIYNEDVEDEPVFEEIADELVNFFLDAESVCAYNGLKFDWPLLNQELVRAGKSTLNMCVIDPLVWERHERDKMSGNSLEQVARRYGVGALGDIESDDNKHLHDAKQDTLLLAGVLRERAEVMPYNFHAILSQQEEYFLDQQEYYNNKYGD